MYQLQSFAALVGSTGQWEANYLAILFASIPVFIMIGIGCLTRIFGLVNNESEKGITKLVIWILYPCFVLSKVPGSESLQSGSVVGTALLVGFLVTVIGFAVAWAVARFIKLDNSVARNTFCVSAGLQNYGFIPFALIASLFGKFKTANGNFLADEVTSVLIVHNLGLEIALWTIGVAILSGTLKGAAKNLVNGPTVAISLALFLNFTGYYKDIPMFIKEPISQLGNCSIPVSLVLVGAALAAVVGSEKWKTHWAIMVGSSLVRFAVMPIVYIVTAAIVSFSGPLQRVLLVEAAMPAAIFPIVLAKHYGGKPEIAAQIVIATTVLSMVMMPVILALALGFFEIEY